MNIISTAELRPPRGGSPRFEGIHYGANVSFFVVTSPPGRGANRHRHPYEEVFIILEGEIEVIVEGEMQMIGGGNIAVIPANSWHEFKNRSDRPCLMVNIHPVPEMIQEDWSST